MKQIHGTFLHQGFRVCIFTVLNIVYCYLQKLKMVPIIFSQ